MAKKVRNAKQLSTGAIVGIVAVVLVLLVGVWVVSSYNGLVASDETVQAKWANVESAYQRRADLIPNLVATVEEFTDYEGELLRDVTQARASVGSANGPSELAAAGGQLDSALSRLLVVMENYPTLTASESFLSLQDELAGTENRIKTERDIYNDAVRVFNVKVRRFPTTIVAGLFGFERAESFEAVEGAENAPQVGDLFN